MLLQECMQLWAPVLCALSVHVCMHSEAQISKLQPSKHACWEPIPEWRLALQDALPLVFTPACRNPV